MNQATKIADKLVLDGGWSRLADFRPSPEIDLKALRQYRLRRIRGEMARNDIPLCLLSNPLSLRYVADIRQYSAFQARVPVMYLALPMEGPLIVYGGFAALDLDADSVIDETREGRALTVFEGGTDLSGQIDLFLGDLRSLADEIGVSDRRLALENLSPLVISALVQEGFEVFDAQALLECARRIKSPEEVECMKWSIAVAEHGMAKMSEALRPNVRENQLWALLNYVNLANDGEWHDSRQLTSGPRTNPFLREAQDRAIEDGDLVAFDTDMIGPFGYCADISRTFHCGPSGPTGEQRDLYRRAYEQLQHNMANIRPGATFEEVGSNAYVHPDGYHRFDLIMHGIGMSDELPFILSSRQDERPPVEGLIEPGMVFCVEAYAGRLGGAQGVKLEEQVLVTADGIEVLTRYPFEAALLQ